MIKVQAIVYDSFTDSTDEHFLEVEEFTPDACREALIKLEGGDDPWKILAMRHHNPASIGIDLESTLGDGTESSETYIRSWGS